MECAFLFLFILLYATVRSLFKYCSSSELNSFKGLSSFLTKNSVSLRLLLKLLFLFFGSYSWTWVQRVEGVL
jgi:hypothetical protein